MILHSGLVQLLFLPRYQRCFFSTLWISCTNKPIFWCNTNFIFHVWLDSISFLDLTHSQKMFCGITYLKHIFFPFVINDVMSFIIHAVFMLKKKLPSHPFKGELQKKKKERKKKEKGKWHGHRHSHGEDCNNDEKETATPQKKRHQNRYPDDYTFFSTEDIVIVKVNSNENKTMCINLCQIYHVSLHSFFFFFFQFCVPGKF